MWPSLVRCTTLDDARAVLDPETQRSVWRTAPRCGDFDFRFRERDGSINLRVRGRSYSCSVLTSFSRAEGDACSTLEDDGMSRIFATFSSLESGGPHGDMGILSFSQPHKRGGIPTVESEKLLPRGRRPTH